MREARSVAFDSGFMRGGEYCRQRLDGAVGSLLQFVDYREMAARALSSPYGDYNQII
jgi:hypothetical protein